MAAVQALQAIKRANAARRGASSSALGEPSEAALRRLSGETNRLPGDNNEVDFSVPLGSLSGRLIPPTGSESPTTLAALLRGPDQGAPDGLRSSSWPRLSDDGGPGRTATPRRGSPHAPGSLGESVTRLASLLRRDRRSSQAGSSLGEGTLTELAAVQVHLDAAETPEEGRRHSVASLSDMAQAQAEEAAAAQAIAARARSSLISIARSPTRRVASFGSSKGSFKSASPPSTPTALEAATRSMTLRLLGGSGRWDARFHPAQPAMLVWDKVIMVLLLYTAFITPFEVCFLSAGILLDDGLWWVDRLVDLLFAGDILVNFNLAFYDATAMRMVTRQPAVLLAYARRAALVDIVSTIPFDVVGEAGGKSSGNLMALRILRIFRLVKLLRVLRSSRVMQRLQDTMHIHNGILSLANFGIVCVLIAHWMACLLHLVQQYQTTECNWVNYYFGTERGDSMLASEHSVCKPQLDVPLASRYLTALYWSVMTISTVGYGDVTPKNDGERIFVILGMMLGASAYACVVGSVCGVLATLSERETAHKQHVDSLNSFITEAKLDPLLARRLRTYLRYAHAARQFPDWGDLQPLLSPGLRGSTVLAIHGPWMADFRLLRAAPPDVRQELAGAFEHSSLPPGEVLQVQNARAEALIAIRKGLVLLSGDSRLDAVLSPHAVLGQQVLWANRRVSKGALTLTFAETYSISRARLLQVVEGHRSFRTITRWASLLSLLQETLTQLLETRRRVRSKIAAAAGPLGWFELNRLALPPGHRFHRDTYSVLTPPLVLMALQAAAPAQFDEFLWAARLMQRRWRRRLRRRVSQVLDETPEARPRHPGRSTAHSNREGEHLHRSASPVSEQNPWALVRDPEPSTGLASAGDGGASCSRAVIADAVAAALAPEVEALRRAVSKLNRMSEAMGKAAGVAAATPPLHPHKSGSGLEGALLAMGSRGRRGFAEVDEVAEPPGRPSVEKCG